MAIRTTTDKVKKLLSYNYDGCTDLLQCVRIASRTVDRIVTCATAKSASYTSEELADLETVLACHYYTKIDPVFSSRSTAGASGSMVRDPKVPEPYKSMAMEMDPHGCVSAALNPNKATAYWGGKTRTEATDWEDRN